MRKGFVPFTLGAMLFALYLPLQAQQINNIPRIGILEPGSLSEKGGTCINGFLRGLYESMPSGKGFASWVGSRERISSSSGARQKVDLAASPVWPLNWSSLRLMFSC
jgi:hypothetical protein